jgi:hypothetical protein
MTVDGFDLGWSSLDCSARFINDELAEDVILLCQKSLLVPQVADIHFTLCSTV